MRIRLRQLWMIIGIPSLLLLLYLLKCNKWLFEKKQRENIAVYHFKASENENSAYTSCTIDTCVNLLPCSVYDNRLTVYVEPLIDIVDERGMLITPKPSKEFLELRSIILGSKYAVNSIDEACVVIPGFDTLNLLRFPYSMALSHAIETVARTTTLLIFVFVGARIPAGKAIVARSQTYDSSFRHSYDVAIPFWYGGIDDISVTATNKSWFLTIILDGLIVSYKENIRTIYGRKMDVLILESCSTKGHNFCDADGEEYQITDAVQHSKFVMLFDSNTAFEWLLIIALKSSTVPVIITDQPSLPFDDILDWNKFSFMFYIGTLDNVYAILGKVEIWRIDQLLKGGKFAYSNYFASLERIVLTTLDVLQKRLIPNSISFKPEWNQEQLPAPLFLPRIAPLTGFTAILLCYPFLKESVFVWLDVLDKATNLNDIIVIVPSGFSFWKDLERQKYSHNVNELIMQETETAARFTISSKVTSEAVFSVNSNAEELTTEQLEYGYQLWRHNPNHLITFSTTDNFNEINKTEYFHSLRSDIISNSKGYFYHNYYNVLYHLSLRAVIDRMPKQLNIVCEQHETAHLVDMFEAILVVRVLPVNSKCSVCHQNRNTSASNPPDFAKGICAAQTKSSQAFHENAQLLYIIPKLS